MQKDFLPSQDRALQTWATNASTILTADATSYGLTAAIASTFSGLVSGFSGALTTALEPSTRTKGTIAAKNTARNAMKDYARLWARVVQGTASVTDQMKIDLGITVRANPSPINPPTESPVMEVVGTNGRILDVKLHAVDTARRGKPFGCAGASIFSFLGSAPPADISLWKFEANVTRTSFRMEFPPTVAAGSQVFLTSFWYSPRGQSGPACFPISAYLAGGVVATTETEAA